MLTQPIVRYLAAAAVLARASLELVGFSVRNPGAPAAIERQSGRVVGT